MDRPATRGDKGSADRGTVEDLRPVGAALELEDALGEADDVGKSGAGGPQEEDEFGAGGENRGAGDGVLEATDLTTGNNNIERSGGVALPGFEDREPVVGVNQGTVLAAGAGADRGADNSRGAIDHFVERELFEGRAGERRGQQSELGDEAGHDRTKSNCCATRWPLCFQGNTIAAGDGVG